MHLANLLFLCLTLGVMRSQAIEYVTFTLNVGAEASDLPEVDDGKGGKKPGDHFVSIYQQIGFKPFFGVGTTETITGNNAPVFKQQFTIKHDRYADQSLRYKLWDTGDDKETLLAEKTVTLNDLCDKNNNRVSDSYSYITVKLLKGELHIKSRIAAQDINTQARNATTNRGNSVLPYNNILVFLALGYFLLQHSISKYSK